MGGYKRCLAGLRSFVGPRDRRPFLSSPPRKERSSSPPPGSFFHDLRKMVPTHSFQSRAVLGRSSGKMVFKNVRKFSPPICHRKGDRRSYCSEKGHKLIASVQCCDLVSSIEIEEYISYSRPVNLFHQMLEEQEWVVFTIVRALGLATKQRRCSTHQRV